MEIEYTEGCICTNLNVDGESFYYLEEEKKREVLDKVIESILKDYDVQNVVIDLLRQWGEYKYHYTCEDCGDSVCSFTLEV